MKLITKNKILLLLLLSIILTGCVENTNNSSTYNYTQTSENATIETVEKSTIDHNAFTELKESQKEIKTHNNDNLSNDDYYINSEGNEVHSPAYAPSIPAGATAKCRDGTYSFSQSRRGTCSHHGGVATWY